MTNQHEGAEILGLGEYLEIDRPRQLVFTFAIPQFSLDFDQIVVEIAPNGSGSLLTLTHEKRPTEFHAANESGWLKMFETLDQVLGRQ